MAMSGPYAPPRRGGRRKHLSRTAIATADDPVGSVLLARSTGAVVAGALSTLADATGDLDDQGVQAGDTVRVDYTAGASYATVTSVAAASLGLDRDLTAGTALSFRVIRYVAPEDLTDCDDALVLVRFAGGARRATVLVQLETEHDGTDRYVLSSTEVAGSAELGAAFAIRHNGQYVRPLVTQIDGGGTVDVHVWPATKQKD